MKVQRRNFINNPFLFALVVLCIWVMVGSSPSHGSLPKGSQVHDSGHPGMPAGQSPLLCWVSQPAIIFCHLAWGSGCVGVHRNRGLALSHLLKGLLQQDPAQAALGSGLAPNLGQEAASTSSPGVPAHGLLSRGSWYQTEENDADSPMLREEKTNHMDPQRAAGQGPLRSCLVQGPPEVHSGIWVIRRLTMTTFDGFLFCSEPSCRTTSRPIAPPASSRPQHPPLPGFPPAPSLPQPASSEAPSGLA